MLEVAMIRRNVLFRLLGAAFCLSALVVKAQGPPLEEQLIADPIEAQELKDVERFYRYAVSIDDRAEKIYYMEVAIPKYEAWLGRYGRNSRNASMARFHLGHSLQTLGNLEAAKKSYQKVVAANNDPYWVGSSARQLAYLALANKDYKSAARYFGVTAKKLPDETHRHTALTRQAQCLVEMGETKRALDVFSSIAQAENHPHREWGIFMRGYILYESERYEEAQEALQPLLVETAGKNYRSQALFYTGLSAAELGDAQTADQFLRETLQINHQDPALLPDDRRKVANNKARAQTALMEMYYRGGDFAEVQKLYEFGDFGATGSLEADRSMTAGKAYLQKERYERAHRAFRKVDRALPNSQLAFEASYRCLECKYKMKHPGLAGSADSFLEIYGKAYGKAPEIQIARFLTGQSYLNLDRFERAAKVFARVREKQLPEHYQPEYFFRQGIALAEIGDFNGATRSLTQFVEKFEAHPLFLEVISRRGQAYERLGDQSSALRDFQAVLDHDEVDKDKQLVALQQIGRILREQKKLPAMIDHFRQFLQKAEKLPRNTAANANYWIGWGYYQQDEHEEALPYLEKAVSFSPQELAEPAGRMLVLIHFAASDATAMEQALDNLLKLRPKKIIPRHMLSWLGAQKFQESNFKKAATYFTRALDPEKPRKVDRGLWRMLAKAQNEVSNYEGAKKSAETALELEKNDRWKADAQLDLARAYTGLGNLGAARQAALTGLSYQAKGPHLAGLHLTLGEIALKSDDFEKAYAEALTTVRMTVDDPLLKPRALYLAAEASEKLGSQSEANRYRRTLEQDFPNWEPQI